MFFGYRPNGIGVAGIEIYAFERANGRKTVGYCSHIVAIIYYSSQARYLSKIVFLLKFSVNCLHKTI